MNDLDEFETLLYSYVNRCGAIHDTQNEELRPLLDYVRGIRRKAIEDALLAIRMERIVGTIETAEENAHNTTCDQCHDAVEELHMHPLLSGRRVRQEPIAM